MLKNLPSSFFTFCVQCLPIQFGNLVCSVFCLFYLILKTYFSAFKKICHKDRGGGGIIGSLNRVELNDDLDTVCNDPYAAEDLADRDLDLSSGNILTLPPKQPLYKSS